MNINIEKIIHTILLEECSDLFRDGYYKQAAFEAMKQIELYLKKKSNAPPTKSGHRLIDWAFGKKRNVKLEVPFGDHLQKDAKRYFKGVFSYYRNYTAHEGTGIDKQYCIRILVIATDLLDLIDASKLVYFENQIITRLIKENIFKDKKELLSFIEFINGYQVFDEVYDGFFKEMALDHGFSETQYEAMFEYGILTFESKIIDQDLRENVNDYIMMEWFELTDKGEEIYKLLKSS